MRKRVCWTMRNRSSRPCPRRTRILALLRIYGIVSKPCGDGKFSERAIGLSPITNDHKGRPVEGVIVFFTPQQFQCRLLQGCCLAEFRVWIFDDGFEAAM